MRAKLPSYFKVLFGILMLAVSWQMTLAAGLFIAIAYVLMKTISRPWFIWAGERMTKVVSDLNSGVLETIHGLVLIKSVRVWSPDLMRQSIDKLDQESNFRSYVADGAEHTILPFDRFYTTHINGVRLRDWFANLVNGQPVDNAACPRGSSLTCP